MATQNAPNLYELQGGKVRVTYSTSSISGQPLFDLRVGRKSFNFSGGQIESTTLPIGTLITVPVESVPDLKTVTFSLLLPDVNLQDAKKVNINALGIFTTAKTSIGGPKLVKGAIQTYKLVALKGTARSVTF